MGQGQSKMYRAGMKPPAGGKTVTSGTQQGATSKTQGGKTHKVKNNTVNHSRGFKK